MAIGPQYPRMYVEPVTHINVAHQGQIKPEKTWDWQVFSSERKGLELFLTNVYILLMHP